MKNGFQPQLASRIYFIIGVDSATDVFGIGGTCLNNGACAEMTFRTKTKSHIKKITTRFAVN